MKETIPQAWEQVLWSAVLTREQRLREGALNVHGYQLQSWNGPRPHSNQSRAVFSPPGWGEKVLETTVLFCVGSRSVYRSSDPPPSPRDVPPPHHTLLHTCTFPPAEELSLHRGALRFRGINFRSSWTRFESQLLPLVTLTLQRWSTEF